LRDPFGVTVPMGGSSFKFDARKSWTAIDAGYSPDEQKHLVAASPVVEILAAIGLENARPDEFETRQVRYSAWNGLVPPVLARPALAGTHIGIPRRVFQFTLALSGKNKVVTFAEEEMSS
jgi:CRISPR-associated protein Csx14